MQRPPRVLAVCFFALTVLCRQAIAGDDTSWYKAPSWPRSTDRKKPKLLVRKELKHKVRGKLTAHHDWEWIATKFFPEESGMVETMQDASCKIEYWQREFYVVLLEKCLLRMSDLVRSDGLQVSAVHRTKGKIWLKATTPQNVKLRLTNGMPRRHWPGTGRGNCRWSRAPINSFARRPTG